ncbi:amino acid racemase [Paenibacillus sp. HB172176]|uniref:aspartate/glutamate racemase family protein n=1 Tax=Paenibacillus sp. HB172176 TaxID=2493690 RepID=UPI00143A6B73|nr:amino acid racemase [Paenibacillus sp. HB172176]
MKQNSLGIIGGMGPKATAVFFDKIIENTVAERDQDHVDMIILNHASIPDRTAVILGGDSSGFLEEIGKDLRLLEIAGAAHIAIPCNTSHYFYEQMQDLTSIPIINMVEETIKLIHERFGSGARVGLLATDGTVQSGIYTTTSRQYGMELHVPNERIQRQVMKIIYTNVKNHMDFSSHELEAIIDELVMEQGCQCVILACTELSCIKLRPVYAECSIDAMQVLVEKSIVLSGRSVVGK